MIHEYAIVKGSFGQTWLEVNGEKLEWTGGVTEAQLKLAAATINGVLHALRPPLPPTQLSYGMPDTFLKRVIHPGDYEKVIEWILQALRSVLADQNAKRSDGMLSASFSNLFGLDEDELKVILRTGLRSTLG